MLTDTDLEWEKWGQKDPYFSVLTQEIYRNNVLTPEAKRIFFESGKKDISAVLQKCRTHIDPTFSPKSALDFGCGTGRIVVPLAEMIESVVGIDISESMLGETRINCDAYSLTNVTLLPSDDNLSSVEGSFELIHSSIVFQHIPPIRGEHIFSKLIDHLCEGGIGVIHFTYFICSSPQKIKYPLLSSIVMKWESLKKWNAGDILSQDPEMQMNAYNMNSIVLILQRAGIHKFYSEFTDHGGNLGIVFYFQK